MQIPYPQEQRDNTPASPETIRDAPAQSHCTYPWPIRGAVHRHQVNLLNISFLGVYGTPEVNYCCRQNQ
jgi:hypothetical protein